MRMIEVAVVARLRTGAMLAAGVVLIGAGAPGPAHAAEFFVNAASDAADVKPGDRQCITAAATCTLRAAVQEANATTGADVILLPAGRFVLATAPAISAGTIADDDPANGDLDIAESLTIRGAGARDTTVDGAGLDRVFASQSGVVVVMSDMTVTGGDATGGGTSEEIDLGGAILNRGTMTLERVRLVKNHADGGGGVFSIPRTYLTVRSSLVADNSAVEGGGLRIDSGGEVIDTTITGNVLRTVPEAAFLPDEMSGYGGGIDHRGGSDVAVVGSTIVNNHALKGGGGLSSGQAYTPVSDRIELGRVRLRNSIIALNTSEAGSANCHTSAQIIESTGHNLADDDSCGLSAAGDLPRRDPLLGPLADNGGPTETRALLRSSPAIDAAAGEGCPRQDQRGVARPQGAACDIGAFEYVEPEPKAKAKGKAKAKTKPKAKSKKRSRAKKRTRRRGARSKR